MRSQRPWKKRKRDAALGTYQMGQLLSSPADDDETELVSLFDKTCTLNSKRSSVLNSETVNVAKKRKTYLTSVECQQTMMHIVDKNIFIGSQQEEKNRRS